MSASTERANPPLTAPSTRKRLPWIMLACVALLSAVLIGGSLFWLLRGAPKRPVSVKKAASPTTVTATLTWVPTQVTPPPRAVFYDTFINNSRGWSLVGDSTDFRILVENMLILVNANPSTTLVESVPTSTNLDNYLVSIDFTINQAGSGDSAGLYLRGDSNLDHDYRVDINSNNTIDVAKEWLDVNQNPQTTIELPPQRVSYLKPLGAQNTLTVIMINQTLTVLLNNRVLATISDSSYASGQIALFVRHGASSRSAVVSFSRVEIDRLASPLATPIPTTTLTPPVKQP